MSVDEKAGQRPKTDIVKRLRSSWLTVEEQKRAADEIERLREALRMVIAANDVFRGTLPKDWESDPVNDACEAARAALEGRHECRGTYGTWTAAPEPSRTR